MKTLYHVHITRNDKLMAATRYVSPLVFVYARLGASRSQRVLIVVQDSVSTIPILVNQQQAPSDTYDRRVGSSIPSSTVPYQHLGDVILMPGNVTVTISNFLSDVSHVVLRIILLVML